MFIKAKTDIESPKYKLKDNEQKLITKVPTTISIQVKPLNIRFFRFARFFHQ